MSQDNTQLSNEIISGGATFALSCLYAALLNTEQGRLFQRDDVSRWGATAIGVGIIGAMTTFSGQRFPWSLFAVGGIPFVAVAVFRGVTRYREAAERAFRNG